MIKTLLQKKVSSMALVGGILSLLGAIFILSAVIMVGITLISLAGTVSTQGAIISCAGYNDGCQPVVRFHTPSDRVITFRSSSSSSSYTPEKTVTVWYHLDNPQNAQLDPWPIITILSLAFGGIRFYTPACRTISFPAGRKSSLGQGGSSLLYGARKPGLCGGISGSQPKYTNTRPRAFYSGLVYPTGANVEKNTGDDHHPCYY